MQKKCFHQKVFPRSLNCLSKTKEPLMGISWKDSQHAKLSEKFASALTLWSRSSLAKWAVQPSTEMLRDFACVVVFSWKESATRATQALSMAKPIREVESPRIHLLWPSHLNLSCVQLDIWTLPPCREMAWQVQPCFTCFVHPFAGVSIAPQDIQLCHKLRIRGSWNFRIA